MSWSECLEANFFLIFFNIIIKYFSNAYKFDKVDKNEELIDEKYKNEYQTVLWSICLGEEDGEIINYLHCLIFLNRFE